MTQWHEKSALISIQTTDSRSAATTRPSIEHKINAESSTLRHNSAISGADRLLCGARDNSKWKTRQNEPKPRTTERMRATVKSGERTKSSYTFCCHCFIWRVFARGATLQNLLIGSMKWRKKNKKKQKRFDYEVAHTSYTTAEHRHTHKRTQQAWYNRKIFGTAGWAHETRRIVAKISLLFWLHTFNCKNL